MSLTETDISEIIALAWCDKTSFERIEEQFGLSEKEVQKLMRKELKGSSYRLWRRRVYQRKAKHQALLRPEKSRYPDRWDSPEDTSEKNRLEDNQSKTRVAIIGAGPAGLMAANILHDNDIEVVVFDKGRRVGGRTSTRLSSQDESWVFDHGAPYFRVSESQTLWIHSLEKAGVVVRWQPRTNRDSDEREYWLARPDMRSLAQYMADNLPEGTIRTGTKIEDIMKNGTQWILKTEKETFSSFDQIICTAPLPQAKQLLFSEEVEGLPDGKMAPVWTVLLECDALGLDEDVLEDIGICQKIIQESQKPNHQGALNNELDHWIIHSHCGWALENIEEDKDRIGTLLISAFSRGINQPIVVRQRQVHRWRYAHSLEGSREAFWVNQEGNLYCAGDGFCFGDASARDFGIERAIASGIAVAEDIAQQQSINDALRQKCAQQNKKKLEQGG